MKTSRKTESANAGSLQQPCSARRHYVEERNSPCSMGVQRRVVTTDGIVGPWCEGQSTAAAWKAYKKMRKAQNAKVSDHAEEGGRS